MRIGLVLYGDLSSSSGGFLYDRFLVDALRRAGDTVDVMTLPWPSYAGGVMHGFDRRLIGRLRAWEGDLLLQDELAHPTLARVNRRLRAAWQARGARPPHSVPIVSIVHHLRLSERPGMLMRPLVRRTERGYLRSVDGFIFNSETTRTVVAGLVGRDRACVVATPGGDRLGAGPGERDVVERARRPGPLRVLYAGTFIPRKGLHTLVAAVSMLPRGSCRLTAAGSRTADPGYTGRIQRMVSVSGLRGFVDFPGHLEDAELAAALRDHHVLAMPSSYEGFGIVYLEAMGFGVVPIASREGGGAEIVENGRSGFLAAPDDPGEMAGLLDRLAGDRERLCSAALEARRRFAGYPGWQRSMEAAVMFLHALPRGRSG